MTTLENSYCVPKTKEGYSRLWSACSKLGFDISRYLFEGVGGSVQYREDEYGKNIYQPRSIDEERIFLKNAKECDVSEVSINQFLDLLHDRISPWRLEEIGFNMQELPYRLEVQGRVDKHTIQVTETGRFIFLNGYQVEGITTFRELLTLIKFLTPAEK